MHGSGLELALVFLLAAVIAVPVFKRFGLGAVLAYLVAGVVLGPDGLALVRDADRILNAAEIGVVMMLFVIGLELSPSRLRVMRKPVFGAGGLQVLLSALLLGGIALLFEHHWKTALVVGLGLALSSTAVSLQLLSERKELTSEHGRLGFAILLFLAGLQGVPTELREAAAIDGASWWQIQRRITIPLLGPTIRGTWLQAYWWLLGARGLSTRRGADAVPVGGPELWRDRRRP